MRNALTRIRDLFPTPSIQIGSGSSSYRRTPFQVARAVQTTVTPAPAEDRAAEALIELPDAAYHYSAASKQLQVVHQTEHPLEELKGCEITSILYHFWSLSDGLVIQCVLSNYQNDAIRAIATIRLSKRLLEEHAIFLALSEMVVAFMDKSNVSINCNTFAAICQLAQRTSIETV